MSKRYNKIRLGIIGTGGMANLHADQFKQVRGVELTACMDVNEDRAKAYADRHGFRQVCPDMSGLLDEVDAVSIVTPDPYHVPMAIEALKAGRHVLCEKPLALSLPEAKKVGRVARQASRRGIIHMINFSYRNSAAFHYAAKLVADGRLGEIRHVHSRYLQHWLTSHQWGKWTDEKWLWRLQSQAGSKGVLGDLGCHLLDFTSGIAGDIKALSCRLHTFPKIDPRTGRRVRRYAGKPLDVNDTAMIELQFANGAVGQTHTTRWSTGHANSIEFEVAGTEGALAIDLDAGYEKVRLCLGKARHKAEWSTRTLKPTPNIYQRFIRSIRSGNNDQPDLLRGVQVQAYLDACERSAEKDGQMTRVRA